jgi:hypothetical protein
MDSVNHWTQCWDEETLLLLELSLLWLYISYFLFKLDISTFAVSAVETWRDFRMFDVHCVQLLFSICISKCIYTLCCSGVDGGGLYLLQGNWWMRLRPFLLQSCHCGLWWWICSECIVILIQHEGLSANAGSGWCSVPKKSTAWRWLQKYQMDRHICRENRKNTFVTMYLTSWYLKYNKVYRCVMLKPVALLGLGKR